MFIDIKDPKKIGDEDDSRIVGHDVTNGNEEGGRTAMENLLQKDPGINLVYTINEPAAAGAYEALKAVGHDVTNGNEEGGRTAMENLLAKDPNINVVYTINEPAAAGAYEALDSLGRADDVLIVSVDGGCPGVENVKEGIIGATSMQFPLLMASKGVEAIAAFAKDGTKPTNSKGLDFFNTGVELVTDQPVDGIESITSEEGLKRCWG